MIGVGTSVEGGVRRGVGRGGGGVEGRGGGGGGGGERKEAGGWEIRRALIRYLVAGLLRSF